MTSRTCLRALLTLALLFGPSSTALAQPQVISELPSTAIVISPGERVVLSAVSAEPSVEARGPLPARDLAAFPKLDNSYETVAPVALKAQIAPVAGSLVMELASSPTDGARLVALNGADFPIIYSAALVLQQRNVRRYVATSICPVPPGRIGIESWGNDVVGIAILSVRRVSPGETTCNNGSLLSATLPPAAQHYACTGQQRGDGPLPLFEVTLVADATGAVSRQSASWGLSRADLLHSPAISFDYAMESDRLTPGARGARVIAAVDLRSKPVAKAADIVLRIDGVEVARRPWRLFADRMAALQTEKGAAPVGFVGVVPFVPAKDSTSDLALRRMLATIGRQPAKLEVLVVGDTGADLAHVTYDIGPVTPVSNPAGVSGVVQLAQAAAKTPAQCPAINPDME